MENREMAIHIANYAVIFYRIFMHSALTLFFGKEDKLGISLFVPLTLQETITIAALFQGICAKLYKLWTQNLNFIIYPRALINENKWRADRYRIEGSMIDFGKETEVNTRVLIYELLDFIAVSYTHLTLPTNREV